MIKPLFIAAFLYFAWNHYNQDIPIPINIPTPTQLKQENTRRDLSPTVNSPHYSCDGRQHCSQMSSRDEAVFFLNNCPNTKMDGDHDGDPCERQFQRY